MEKRLTIDTGNEDEIRGPLVSSFFPEEKGEPSPRHSEYIYNPNLSQKLRKETDA
jgi:hypothetical protein